MTEEEINHYSKKILIESPPSKYLIDNEIIDICLKDKEFSLLLIRKQPEWIPKLQDILTKDDYIFLFDDIYKNFKYIPERDIDWDICQKAWIGMSHDIDKRTLEYNDMISMKTKKLFPDKPYLFTPIEVEFMESIKKWFHDYQNQ